MKYLLSKEIRRFGVKVVYILQREKERVTGDEKQEARGEKQKKCEKML